MEGDRIRFPTPRIRSRKLSAVDAPTMMAAQECAVVSKLREIPRGDKGDSMTSLQRGGVSAAFAILAILSPAALAQLPTANAYVQHNLVSDIPGMADVTDSHLVAPWGISESATSPFWISNDGTGTSTLYNGSGAITALVVTIAPGAKSPTPTQPTGQVNNNTTGFILANGIKASFI